MSWQAYVDQSLVGTGHVDKAAIFNTEGTSCWATSKDFKPSSTPPANLHRGTQLISLRDPQLSPQELREVVTAYNDTNEPKAVQATGLHLAGEKYFVIKADEKSLYGKKGKEGVVIVKTKQTLLITHYPETVQPGQAATVVEKLGDYLVGTGY
ncbi:hypothetical protein EPUS_02308 [Endocarpon pusillum Z07020]|uniref:Profilin n=1 Tax=Endocarpon pusillum (strain Z07020 / HMAS-L-300199) TaxID=1263415 RepID=U1I3X0_ENDPU|nr:uncharacterized protein EPUS_02308 [Endocarpon pusillum Z07020]ERF76769.1 hypothetical protein EPUS_02308 [Endocarpon pusillum Z07020]